MQIPEDAVFQGMGFDENGQWHQGSYIDFWRWSFSDLPDDGMRSTLADVIAKILLDAEPESLTARELEVWRLTSLIASSGRNAGKPALTCDA